MLKNGNSTNDKVEKTYIGTKIVKAVPAIRKGGKVYVAGELIPGNVEPMEEGYKVIYPDGYESWSPKAVFEAAYRPIDPNEARLITE